jgi:hypothetical protein
MRDWLDLLSEVSDLDLPAQVSQDVLRRAAAAQAVRAQQLGHRDGRGSSRWRSRLVLWPGVIGACLLVVAALALAAHSRGTAPTPAHRSSPSGTVVLNPMLSAEAKEAGVDPASVREALSVGAEATGVSILSGVDANGQVCSLFTNPGQRVGGGFRCGTFAFGGSALGPNSVEANVAVSSGSDPVTAAADSETIVGVAGNNVASVILTLTAGRTAKPEIVSSTLGRLFGFQATDPSQFPTLVSAYDAKGNLLSTSPIVG